MIDLSGRIALVTGSSRGIGRCCALRLAQAGADIVVNYVSRRNAAEETARTIVALGRRAVVVKADVSRQADVEEMATLIKEHYGALDILVSNVAAGGFRPLLESTTAQFEQTLRTNVQALIFLLRAFRLLLVARNGQGDEQRLGKVVALTSHGSRFALPDYALVGMSKAALESLVRYAARELGPDSINVNAVLAGLVETESTRSMPAFQEAFRRQKQRTRCGLRSLTAEEVADAVLFLASPLSDLIQGQILTVDGGAGLSL